MFDHLHYVPILKWRMGEYQALMNLTPSVKAWVTPLIEIPKETWDFELQAPSKSLDDHLAAFGTKLRNKWGTQSCFVDSCHIPADSKLGSGVHHLVHLFDLARAAGVQAIPVTGLKRTTAYQAAVASIASVDEKGICIRLTPQDFVGGLAHKMDALAADLGLGVGSIHLVIDSGSDILEAAGIHAAAWHSMLLTIPRIKDYATVTIAASSIPSSFSTASLSASNYIPRREWAAYKELLKLPLPRVPTFGDYGVLNPLLVEMDPRFIDPNAKIKYATSDAWFIALGKQVKKNGRAQYKILCQSVIAEQPPIFGGATYSYGDYFIDACANGGSTGGTSTWPTVTTNRHISVTVKTIASQFGSATPP